MSYQIGYFKFSQLTVAFQGCCALAHVIVFKQLFVKHKTQYVVYNDLTPSHEIITCIAPQGSINYIVCVSNLLFSFRFGDDSKVFISVKYIDELVAQNMEICKVVHWLRISKLSLNLKNSLHGIQKISVQNCAEQRYYWWQFKHQNTMRTKFVGMVFDRNFDNIWKGVAWWTVSNALSLWGLNNMTWLIEMCHRSPYISNQM